MIDTVTDGMVAVTTVAPRSDSPVSWAAVIGGGLAGTAVSVILLALGTGIGLASISAWPGLGVTAITFGVTSAIWLIIVQWLSSAMGGYLAGRLRTKWVGIHTDEAFFRDTVHGFLSWALSVVIGASLLAFATSWAVSGVARSATTVAAATAQGSAQGAAAREVSDPTGYLVDTLFRSNQQGATASQSDPRAEAMRMLAADLRNGDVPDTDKAYLAQLVSVRTGLSQADAMTRVDDVIAKVKTAVATVRHEADATRKAASYASFFTAFALLIGAFIASAAGALGGRHRDQF
jgi:hypothetical protein